MNMEQKYQYWLENVSEDQELLSELEQINGDANKIEDRFYRDLRFGTGGLRGILGAGTNRMNLYIVRKATQGIADFLKRNSSGMTSVAIAYDSRINSELFAWETARVLAGNGIRAWIYPTLMPTPALSFAVRHLHCSMGVCITASHNPAQYNGYKVYGPDGCQITVKMAEEIQRRIDRVDCFKSICLAERNDAGIVRIEEEVIDAYLDTLCENRLSDNALTELSVTYTPLHGAGYDCVMRMFRQIGVGKVVPVKSQEKPDGHFPTCPYPNPELREALQEGLETCAQEKTDLLLATDPDCDRVGIAVRQGNRYVIPTGNEVGVLLLDYLCKMRQEQGRMPEHPVAVKTIVTTDMARDIAEHYGVALWDVLTGFKFIGEQIGLLEKEGAVQRFLFGFEESCGYLSCSEIRDKDAVNACMLICEMTAYWKGRGITLWERLEQLMEQYGHYKNRLLSFSYEGAAGMKQMHAVMQKLRQSPPADLSGMNITQIIDYLIVDEHRSPLLPASDVLEFIFSSGKLVIRPSGTEPKLKAYLFTREQTSEKCECLLDGLEKDVRRILS